MVLTPAPVEQRHQGEHSRVAGPPERQRCEAVLTPAQATEHVPGIGPHRTERGIQRVATDRVVDNIEAFAGRMPLDIVFHGLGSVIDGRGSQRTEEVETARRAGGKDLGTTGLGQLYGCLADAPRSTMHQNTLAGMDIGAIHQPLPCRDEYQGQCGSLAHAQLSRLRRDQAGIDGDVLGHAALVATDSSGHTENFHPGSEACNPRP